MTSKTPLRAFGSLVLFILGSLAFTGCNEIEDTVAVVYVQNSLGAPVQGAESVLRGRLGGPDLHR